MDLVKIGFVVSATGLKDANTEVNKLLDKVDSVGVKGKKAASEFETSQKKIKDSTQKAAKEVDKTTKALEKQKIIGDYLSKGLDKTTASIMANFQMLGAKTSDLDKMFTQLGKNKGAVELNKKVEKLQKEYNDISKASVKYLGGGILDQVGYQEQDLKNLNDQYRRAEQQVKEHGQKIQKQYEDISKSSTKRLGGGILDRIGFQESDLIELNNQYKALENSTKAHLAETEKIRKEYDNISKSSTKNLGGGILDRVSTKNTELEEMRKMYKEDERIADARDKSQQATLEKEKIINAERQKAISLEQAKAKYVKEGFGKTDAGRLARLEVSGTDVTTLNNYKAAIEATTKATQALNPTIEKATTNHNKFLDQVKGITIYAALSAAIYGVMTAMTNLAVATVKMADEYTAIQNRMKLYITDSKELGKVNNQLAQFSMENNVGLRETATLFSRLAPAMQKIGANTAAVTSVVDAFGKSMRIGGATAMEAASATIQFSQAMASGKLAGDEFRAISEASPRFLKAIADGSGIAAEKLKEMSSAGYLTTEVISKALLKEYPKLIEENKKLGVTMEQGANAIKTGFLVAIGEFNEGAKITEALGESMMDLAQSMFTFAQIARKTGADVKKWFEENASAINTVIDAVKILSAIVISRYVASLTLAGIASVKLTYQTSALAAAQTASARSFVIGATAVTAFGRAAQTAFSFFGGVAGIALTIGGLAASYLLLRDNAAEATNKIVEQSEYVDLTTEAYKKLNAEQQKNAQSSLIEDMGKINTELDSQADAVNRVLLSYAQFKQMQGKALNQETADVINQTVKGLISYDTAYRKLIDLGVPKNIVEDFKQQKIVYDEAAKAGLKTEVAARAAGLGIKLSGNEAQNATPSVQGMKNAVTGLGDEASITGLKVQAFGKSMQDLVGTYTNLLKLRKATGLNETFGTKALEEGQNLAAKNESVVKFNRLLAKSEEDLNNKRQKGVDVSKEQLKLDKAREVARKGQENLAFEYAKQVAPLAKAAQNAQEANSEYTASLKQQGKEQDKISKETDKIVDKYESQEAVALRLTQYLRQGVAYSVAKKASEEKYAKVYGSNLDMAKRIVQAEKELAELESNAKAREDAKDSLKSQLSSYRTIVAFMKEGFSYAVAQKTVQDGFTANTDGIIHANATLLSMLQEKSVITEGEIQNQQDLLDFVKGGLSVEQAAARGAIYRNKHLNDGVRLASEALAEQEKELLYRKALLNLEVDLNSQKEQAANLASSGSNELASIMSQYKGIGVEEAKSYQTQQRIVTKLTEYNDLLERQKSMTEDISNINFDVFGDFGNPFKSALEGLNNLLFGMGDVSSKYQEVFNAIDVSLSKQKEGTKEHADLVKQKANLELLYIDEKEKAQDAAITSGLSLTKSFFKENSKGYKIISGMEKVYQASKIAFALWEKKDVITMSLLKLKAHITDALGFTNGAVAKMTAQEALNITIAQGSIASAAQAPPPVGFASAAAMMALLAGIGIAIGGASGGSSGSFETPNNGTGTVFGDTEAKSASVKNSIELLSKNSDLMLPLTSAMLASLKNIESNIGNVTNLVLRQAINGSRFNVQEGFQQNTTGKLIGGAGQLALGGMGAVGGVIGGSFAAGLLGASAGSALGIGLGVLTGGVGLILGAALGKALGGLFGSKTSIKGQGLFADTQKLGDIITKGFDLFEYVDVQIKKKALGITTSTKNSTQTSAADAVLEKQFTLIFSGFYDSILKASTSLEANIDTVKGNLENAVIRLGKIDLQGLKGDEIQEKLEAVFGAAADSLAQQGFAGLDDFQKVGEGYYETLIRVASSVEQAKYFTDQLNVSAIKYTDILNKQGDVATEIVRQSVLLVEGNKNIKGGFYDLVNTFDGTAEELSGFIIKLRDLQDQLFMTGKNADYLTSTMILGAGGLDKLASGLDAYFEMLSPAEQAAELTRRLTKEFAIFGKDLPSDVKAFRNLVNSIDISTEAGQKLYGQIIALAPEFNDLQDSLKNANSEVNALVQSLRDLAEQAKGARGETDQTRNLASIRSEFDRASTLAMQGDIDAANRLVDLGKELMGVSKTYATSSEEYTRDLALIQRAATVAADLQAKGLGTTTTPTLTTTAGTTTTPTIETTNSTMSTDMQTMREELSAGLFAIAKFVQNIDSRTERWDDGNRVMVGVLAENGDTPLPVTTV